MSVSNPKSKYVAHLSVLSRISNFQGLGRKNKFENLKTYRSGDHKDGDNTAGRSNRLATARVIVIALATVRVIVIVLVSSGSTMYKYNILEAILSTLNKYVHNIS